MSAEAAIAHLVVYPISEREIGEAAARFAGLEANTWAVGRLEFVAAALEKFKPRGTP